MVAELFGLKYVGEQIHGNIYDFVCTNVINNGSGGFDELVRREEHRQATLVWRA
jgi:hypothetical protein